MNKYLYYTDLKPLKLSDERADGRIARYDYICIARDLCYPQSVIKRIENAKTEFEIQQILIEARHKT